MSRHSEDFSYLKCCCGYTKKEVKVISPKELNPHNYPTTPDIEANLKILLYRINQVRSAYGEPMTVTSGLRSIFQQEALIDQGKSNAPHSKHLSGEAVDILDEDHKLRDWVKLNLQLMETIGFWFESFDSTPTWIHFQIVPPKSGIRIFIP